MDRSVEWRLRSDVKVGTCLSGGLDSSNIASLASKKYQNEQEKFSAVTAQSIDMKEDESAFAKIVVDDCNLKWLVTSPTSADFLFYLDDVIYSQDEPFISPSVYMQHFVMKKARENGVVVLLDGQGADEVLLGYPKYLGAYFNSLPKTQLLQNMMNARDRFGTSALAIFKYYWYFTSFSVRYKRNIWRFNDVSAKYLQYVNPAAIKTIANSYKDIRAMQELEIFSTQMPSLLRFEDKNSMANSIESRLPYLDWNFVETALSINNQFKIKDGWSKYILRKSMDDNLPKEIVWRKKKFGFNAPVSVWFDNFTEAENHIRESKILGKIFGNKIPAYEDEKIKWRMINIARWEELCQVEID
jgi:asparagine synthase (glutamine-hydrolysing)